MSETADICLMSEGGYPYILGGVASWTDTLIRSLPRWRFHIVTLSITAQDRKPRYALPENVQGITDVLLDGVPAGNWFTWAGAARVNALSRRFRAILTHDDGAEFAALMHELDGSGLGFRQLLESRAAWRAMEQSYASLLPNAPLIDFFWTWRFLLSSLIAIATAPIPRARVYHALSTGYAGLFGARAKSATQCPLIITEHGIYTNERRIELCVADWIYDSGTSGFSVLDRAPELRDLWLNAFSNFSRIAYNSADVITTQFRVNQEFQLKDGAPEHKMQIIPNGIDVDEFAPIESQSGPRRPRILLVGRIVPIKDVRTYILAAGILRQFVPDVEAVIIGPDDEDPAYANECRMLVKQHRLENVVTFLGRVPDIVEQYHRSDVIVLTSISEAQPLAILEGGAAGLPAVATDVGSCREIVEGDTIDPTQEPGGFVVPACDPQATAEALARLLRDPALRDRMGQALRARVRGKYNQKRIRRMYEALYLSQLDEAGRVAFEDV